MPPKRRRTTTTDLTTTLQNPPTKKQKLDEEETNAKPKTQPAVATKTLTPPKNPSPKQNEKKDQKLIKKKKQNSPQATSDDEDEEEEKPICRYDEKCFRKNPEHLARFRHPKKMKLEEKKQLSSVTATDTPSIVPQISPPVTAGSTLSPMAVSTIAPPTDQVPSIVYKSIDVVNTPGKKKPCILKKTMSIDDLKKSASRPELENYKNILRFALMSNKISAETKRNLRAIRKEKSISFEEHDQLLGQFGWTADEYEDGEKQSEEEFELDEEKEVLADPNGFKVIEISKDQIMNKKQENVWSRATAKFYQTMSKAQANYTITKVGLIVNTMLRYKFNAKKLELMTKDPTFAKEEWGFHGTSESSIFAIAKSGFLHPDDLAKLKLKTKTKTTTTTNIKGKKNGSIKGKTTKAKKKVIKKKKSLIIKPLDDGFFGKGIYFSLFSDYAMWYSEERESNQILLSKLLPGKSYHCTKRIDGQSCIPGYDSHYSPKGNEIVVFEASQCLPRYILTFECQEAEDREQEG